MNKRRFNRLRRVSVEPPTVLFSAVSEKESVLYDENLLERSRIQWQFGDWQSLVQLTGETLQQHPDRAKLALLTAAGFLQLGQDSEGRKFLRLSIDWGVDRKLVCQVLISGVYNSLGRATAISNGFDRSLSHFESAVAIVNPSSEVKLLTKARSNEQCAQINFFIKNENLKSHKKIKFSVADSFKENGFKNIQDCVAGLKSSGQNVWFRVVKDNEITTFSTDFSDGVYLAKLCDKFGSDKGSMHNNKHPYPWPAHNYNHYYSLLFGNNRENVRRVFECGIGTNNPNLKSNMSSTGVPGASLRVWREYFPNALIIGGDIDRDILFQENRIHTHHLDQTDRSSIKDFWRAIKFSEVDIIIDDGLHEYFAGITLFEESISHLSKTGVYIIEDVAPDDIFKYIEYFKTKPYDFKIVMIDRQYSIAYDNNLAIIKHR